MSDIFDRLRNWTPKIPESWKGEAMTDPVHVEYLEKKLDEAEAEIDRLTLENWQLKGALGYPVPGDIPEGPFKCGLCEARAALEGK